MTQQITVSVTFQGSPPRKTTVARWIEQMMAANGFTTEKRKESSEGVVMLFEREERLYPEEDDRAALLSDLLKQGSGRSVEDDQLMLRAYRFISRGD